MSGKKISDEQLRKEITENQKTEKEIAHSNGYGYPSNALNSRIRDLGFTSNHKITVKPSNAGQFYLGSEPMEEMAGQKGIDLQDVDKVFFKQVGDVEGGRITLEMTTDSFRKTEGDTQ